MFRSSNSSATALTERATFLRNGQVFVFRFASGRTGRERLYLALEDYLRRGLLVDEDVHAILMQLDGRSESLPVFTD